MMHQELKKAHEWNVADTVTSMRMAASVFLLLFSLDTIWFLVVYTFAGLTDVLDGWLARKTGSISEFGARLDSMHFGICCVSGRTGHPSFEGRLYSG